MSRVTAMTLKSYTYGPASQGQPKQLVILLHGLGADGRDLLGLAPVLAQGLRDAVFVAPDAPQPCDMAPMGWQWFSLQDWSFDSILSGVQKAAPGLMAFIEEQQKKYNVAPADTALIGFSQGTMMSLYVAPRLPEPIAGVVGFSGALIWEPETDAAVLHKTPILLIHGDQDTVVPVAAYHHAAETLRQAGMTVTGGVTKGLMHNIDEAGLRDAAAFLKTALAA